jgi:poly-gamma-glutamate capsule biosynthesis protein CapA/YwtB (metallophosphatase superfamily)
LDSVQISFLGDISLNNRYCLMEGENPFSALSSIVNESDYVVANLEALICGNQGFNLKKIPYLYTDDKGIKLLAHLNLNLLSTAHNHVFDNFDDGYRKTVEFLEQSKIKHVGSSLGNDEYRNGYFIKIKDTSFYFLNYCHPNTNFAEPENSGIRLNIYNKKTIEEDIKRVRSQVDFVVLLLHWGGNTDYGFLPDIQQTHDARVFIDAGADCIIGHHAHRIQPMETYKGKPIFYCLGNFCFDDIISHGKISVIRKSAKYGWVAQLNFSKSKNKIKSRIKGISNNNLVIEPSFSAGIQNCILRPLLFVYRRLSIVQSLYSFYLKKVQPFMFYVETSNRTMSQIIWTAFKKRIGIIS